MSSSGLKIKFKVPTPPPLPILQQSASTILEGGTSSEDEGTSSNGSEGAAGTDTEMDGMSMQMMTDTENELLMTDTETAGEFTFIDAQEEEQDEQEGEGPVQDDYSLLDSEVLLPSDLPSEMNPAEGNLAVDPATTLSGNNKRRRRKSPLAPGNLIEGSTGSTVGHQQKKKRGGRVPGSLNKSTLRLKVKGLFGGGTSAASNTATSVTTVPVEESLRDFIDRMRQLGPVHHWQQNPSSKIETLSRSKIHLRTLWARNHSQRSHQPYREQSEALLLEKQEKIKLEKQRRLTAATAAPNQNEKSYQLLTPLSKRVKSYYRTADSSFSSFPMKNSPSFTSAAPGQFPKHTPQTTIKKYTNEQRSTYLSLILPAETYRQNETDSHLLHRMLHQDSNANIPAGQYYTCLLSHCGKTFAADDKVRFKRHIHNHTRLHKVKEDKLIDQYLEEKNGVPVAAKETNPIEQKANSPFQAQISPTEEITDEMDIDASTPLGKNILYLRKK